MVTFKHLSDVVLTETEQGITKRYQCPLKDNLFMPRHKKRTNTHIWCKHTQMHFDTKGGSLWKWANDEKGKDQADGTGVSFIMC